MPTIPIRWADNTDELKRNLKEGLNQIEATRAGAERMVKAFSGDKLITAAHNFAAAVRQLGGVEKLTNAERERGNALLSKALEKYQALGQQAPAALRELANATAGVSQKTSVLGDVFGSVFRQFTAANLVDRAVSGLVSFTKEALSSAGAIVDLSNKLGVSTDAIQRWTIAGKASNTSTEEFANAAFRLGVNISGGKGSVKDALEELAQVSGDVRISWQKLRDLPLEQKFQVVNEALAKVTDADTRNRLGVELYGKVFASVAAAVADGYTKMAKDAKVSSDAQLKALDELADKWDEFVATQKTRLQAWAGENVVFFQQLAKLTKEQREEFDRLTRSDFFQGPSKARAFVLGLAEQERERAKPQPVTPGTKPVMAFSVELAKARAEVAALTAEERRQIVAANALGKSTDEITNRFGISEAALKVLNEQTRLGVEASRRNQAAKEKEREELARLYESIRKLEVITPGLREQVGVLNDTELKAIQIWLDKRKAADELTAAIQKMLISIEHVKVGAVDVDALGGLDVESIGRLKNHLDSVKTKTDTWREAVAGVSNVFRTMAGFGSEAFQRIASTIGAGIDAVGGLKGAFDSLQASTKMFSAAGIAAFADVFSAAFALTSAVIQLFREHWDAIKAGFKALWGWVVDGFKALGQALMAVFKAIADAIMAIFRGIKNFFGALIGKGWLWGRGGDKPTTANVPGAASGGLVTATGIQRFAAGGIVAPRMPMMGRDTVPIMAEPGELILNKQQQAGFGGVTVNVTVDARGAFGVDRYALRRWGRVLAPEIARAVAENKRGSDQSGAFTTMRGALAMPS